MGRLIRGDRSISMAETSTRWPRQLAVAPFLLLLVFLGACGNDEPVPQKQPRQIEVLLPRSDKFGSPELYSSGAQDPTTAEVEVEQAEDPAEQQRQLERAIDDGVDGIVIKAINPRKLAPQLRAARRDGIRVVALENVLPGDASDLAVIGDDFSAGWSAAEVLVHYLRCAGRFAIAEPEAGGGQAGARRAGGFEAGVEALCGPGHLADTYMVDLTKEWTDWVEGIPDLAGVFAIDDNTALSALASANDHAPLIRIAGAGGDSIAEGAIAGDGAGRTMIATYRFGESGLTDSAISRLLDMIDSSQAAEGPAETIVVPGALIDAHNAEHHDPWT